MWHSAVVAGVSGALAALVASALVRDRGQHKTSYAIVFALVFAGLNGMAQRVITPELRAWDARRSAAGILSQNRLLRTLSERHPELRESFADMVSDLARTGSSGADARAAGVNWGRTKVGELLPQYLPVASDVALVQFTEANVEAIEVFTGRSDPLCFAWLRGEATPIAGEASAIPEAVLDHMSNAMAVVIESAPAPNQTHLDDAVATVDMQRVAATVAINHGSDTLGRMAALGDPNPRLDDKQKLEVCKAAATLYKEVLTFPEPHRSGLLRHLLSIGGSEPPRAAKDPGAPSAG
jgi:hypothetical protein